MTIDQIKAYATSYGNQVSDCADLGFVELEQKIMEEFENFMRLLTYSEQNEARQAYWEAYLSDPMAPFKKETQSTTSSEG